MNVLAVGCSPYLIQKIIAPNGLGLALVQASSNPKIKRLTALKQALVKRLYFFYKRGWLLKNYQ